MSQQYVEQHDGGYWLAGTRVSLDSVVYAFLEGLSPESIVDSFDTLTLEQVYGAIVYYLGCRHYFTTDTVECCSGMVDYDLGSQRSRRMGEYDLAHLALIFFDYFSRRLLPTAGHSRISQMW